MSKVESILIESLQESLLWDWVVLTKKAYDIVCEIAHVFANQEADVAANNLLIVDYVVSELLSNPLSICNICKFVSLAYKHGNRHINILERNQSCMLLLANVKPVRIVICPYLEPIFSDILGIV